jgi:hypothetical protein
MQADELSVIHSETVGRKSLMSISDTELQAIGKSIKRDILAAVAGGKLPARTYAVHTRHEWYCKDVMIWTDAKEKRLYATDEERDILVAIALRYQLPDKSFGVMIDQSLAYVVKDS